MASMDEATSEGYTVHFDLQVPEGESALVNSVLVKRLCQATLLLVDREHRRKRSVVEMFSSFYPIIIEVSFFDKTLLSFSLFFFFFFFLTDLSFVYS